MAMPMSILTLSDRHSSDPSNFTPHVGGPLPSMKLSKPTGKIPVHELAIRSRSNLATAPVLCPIQNVENGALHSVPNANKASSGSDANRDKPYYSDEKIYVETSRVPSHFPTHPLIELQGPFEESMLDAGKKEDCSNYRETNPDKFKGRSRRSLILNQKGGAGNVSYNAQWTSDSESKHHPIMKIMSQVIFGVHLLCQSIAQSVPEVSNILSGFVQELDSFLERVNGDFDQSLKEVSDLYRNLALPLQHVAVFDNLLTDRKYRTQTLEGNIRIDALIKAYSQMMTDYTADLAKLQEANLVFSTYLERIGAEWTRDSREQWDIYVAMRKNTGIWENNVKILQEKARKLGKMLQRCALCVNEFEKRCAAAARRTMVCLIFHYRAITSICLIFNLVYAKP
ncbi:hypothetical protein EJ05DRAFT_242811 [Pseudovirgaria hyperparasitica]|uniref:Uncharacterized protein n=1 Tax=Pseudovirgaria hyperparasitica TaxID=470096 RepID=A0A6A6WDK7_9PEZI|nr:uncharacterized protein EJ05DRAFT_242811 [Pseudovirgaria hyperparasitica]KAF2760793.1 hypothetical protein EJ05DRAFT_242811 [Pseudovirgaria hyperparasitica]